MKDGKAGVANFFNYVYESYSVRDVLYFEVKINEEQLKNSKKMKGKWESVYNTYFEGGNE